MSNNYTAISQTLCAKGTKILQSAMAPLAAFAKVFEIQQPDKPALTSQTPIATVAPATASGASIDYSAGDCTVSNIQIAHTRYSQNFGLSATDLGSGARLEWLAELNAAKLAETLTDAVMTLVTTGNFGAAAVSVTSANFALGDFETLVGAIGGRSAVVLNTPYWVKVKPTWLPVGFGAVHELNRWASAGTNIKGFVATPDAIVIRTGIAMTPGLEVIDRQLIVLEPIGITVEQALWFAPASRSIRCAYGCYFGAGVGDSAALKILATP